MQHVISTCWCYYNQSSLFLQSCSQFDAGPYGRGSYINGYEPELTSVSRDLMMLYKSVETFNYSILFHECILLTGQENIQRQPLWFLPPWRLQLSCCSVSPTRRKYSLRRLVSILHSLLICAYFCNLQNSRLRGYICIYNCGVFVLWCTCRELASSSCAHVYCIRQKSVVLILPGGDLRGCSAIEGILFWTAGPFYRHTRDSVRERSSDLAAYLTTRATAQQHRAVFTGSADRAVSTGSITARRCPMWCGIQWERVPKCRHVCSYILANDPLTFFIIVMYLLCFVVGFTIVQTVDVCLSCF